MRIQRHAIEQRSIHDPQIIGKRPISSSTSRNTFRTRNPIPSRRKRLAKVSIGLSNYLHFPPEKTTDGVNSVKEKREHEVAGNNGSYRREVVNVLHCSQLSQGVKSKSIW